MLPIYLNMLISELIELTSKVKESKVRGLFKRYQAKYRVENPRKSTKVLITTKPIIKFVNLPVIVTASYFNLHPKSVAEKETYLTYRYLSIASYQYFYSQTSSYIQSAKIVADIFIEILDDFNQFDYFLEFLLLPQLQAIKDKILAYILTGLLHPEIYKDLRYSDNPFLDVSTEIDIGDTKIERLRFIQSFQDQIYIRKKSYIMQIPVEILPKLDSRRIELINFGDRPLGIYDKRIQTTFIRNSLTSLFYPFSKNVKLFRSDSNRDNTEQNTYHVKFFKTSLSISFDPEDDTSIVYIYQIMSTFLPLRMDNSTISLDKLGSWKHDMILYDQPVGIKFNPIHPDQVINFDAFGTKISILNLSPRNFPRLKQNFEAIHQEMPKLFKVPDMQVEFFGFQIRDPLFNEVYEYYYELLGGHHGMISSSRLIPGDFPVSFTIIRGNDEGYLQIHSKKRFAEKYQHMLSMNDISYQLVKYSCLEVINMLEKARIDHIKDKVTSLLKTFTKSKDYIII